MIENKFPVTVEGLEETGKRVLWYTPRFRKTAIGMPLVVIVLLVVAKLWQRQTSLLLLILLGAAMIFYCLSSTRKVPRNMAQQLYRDLKKKTEDDEEPQNHTRVTEGGVLVVGVDDDSDQMYPFSTIERVFGTEHFIVAMNTSHRAIMFRRDGFVEGDEAALLSAFRTHCPAAKFDEKSLTPAPQKPEA